MPTYLDDTSPADTDAVKNGALSIRSLKTALNTIIGKIFDSAGNFLPGWIVSAMFGAGQVGTVALADGSITSSKYAPNSITTAALAAGAVTTTDIAGGAVTDAQVGAASVNANKLVAQSITATQIAPLTITDALIAAATLTNDKSVVGENARLFTGTYTTPSSGATTVVTGWTPDMVWIVFPGTPITGTATDSGMAFLATKTGSVPGATSNFISPAIGTAIRSAGSGTTLVASGRDITITWLNNGFSIPANSPWGAVLGSGVVVTFIALKI